MAKVYNVEHGLVIELQSMGYDTSTQQRQVCTEKSYEGKRNQKWIWKEKKISIWNRSWWKEKIVCNLLNVYCDCQTKGEARCSEIPNFPFPNIYRNNTLLFISYPLLHFKAFNLVFHSDRMSWCAVKPNFLSKYINALNSAR